MSNTYRNTDDLLDMAAQLDSQDVQTMLDIRTVCQKRRQQPIDVEQRLRQFHTAHDTRSNHTSRKAVLISLLAVAAVFAGIIFLLAPKSATTIPQDTIFTADAQQTGISLTNEHGEEITLSPNTRQSSSITLDDFRKAFASKENVEQVTLSVPFGKSTDITLPDGSIAYLHPGSRLIFPTAFTDGKRVVMLDGEAYFKVTRDTSHPFVVLTDDIETTVLGTEFNINTRSRQVTLITGSVACGIAGNKQESANDRQKVILTPGQQFTVQNSQSTVHTVDLQPYEFWRDGYLYFDNVELRDIMEAIGKNFNMTVEFRNQQALHYKMRFITERNNGIEAALDMMNRMKKVHVRKEGNKILVE